MPGATPVRLTAFAEALSACATFADVAKQIECDLYNFSLHEVTGAPQYNYSHVNEWVWHLNRTKCLSSVWWVIFAFVTPSLLPGGLYITQFVRYFATRTLCGSCDLEWSGWLEKNGHHFIWKHDGGDTIASISSVIQSAASCDRFEPSGRERVDMG
ncbi:hypothetical protein BD769DRAFT_1397413 [Suillus cothurnatus]|nr:hypothetical protein BD769DRAFT_1397413 [Suillus cothurnatus]